MTLREARCEFSELLIDLLLYAKANSYNFALDEGMQHQNKGHMKDSLHYSGCAQDILLFDDQGNYLRTTETYWELGEYWKGLHKYCRWGGDWGDGGHFSFSPPELFGKRA